MWNKKNMILDLYVILMKINNISQVNIKISWLLIYSCMYKQMRLRYSNLKLCSVRKNNSGLTIDESRTAEKIFLCAFSQAWRRRETLFCYVLNRTKQEERNDPLILWLYFFILVLDMY